MLSNWHAPCLTTLFPTVNRVWLNVWVLSLLHVCYQLDACLWVLPCRFLETGGIGFVLKHLWCFGCQKQQCRRDRSCHRQQLWKVLRCGDSAEGAEMPAYFFQSIQYSGLLTWTNTLDSFSVVPCLPRFFGFQWFWEMSRGRSYSYRNEQKR